MRVEPALRSAISGACRASTPISPAAPGTITISTSSSKTAPSGVVSEIENLRAPSATSAPSSDTCRLLARDHAAPEPTLALAKAASLGRDRVRPLAWCSRPRYSAASLEGPLMASWHAAAAAPAPARAPARKRPRTRDLDHKRARPAPRRRAKAKGGVAGGLAWIIVAGVLLTGIVALNVAVLRLNIRLDHMNKQSQQLQAEDAAPGAKLPAAG